MMRNRTDHVPDNSRIKLIRGTVIRDTYTVDRHLGAGQFSDVYLVRHLYMGMQAMKVFRLSENEEEYTDGFNEAFLLSKITHPNILRVFDANRLDADHQSAAYLAAEYVSGGTLTELLNEQYLTVTEALDIAVQISEAVAHAHSQDPPIVHRDIKPQNILFEENDKGRQVKVADFGLAKHVNRITTTVAGGGTLLYMSPESLVGYETPGSDVYSLGLVCYQLLCDCLPYRISEFPKHGKAHEITKILDGWQRESFQPPSYFKSDVSPDIDNVILRSLAHDPKARYGDAVELKDALQVCQQAFPATSSDQGATAGDTAIVDEESKKRAEQAMRVAFQVAATPGREGEALEWLEQAVHLDPGLRTRYGIYLDLWRGKPNA